MPKLLQRQLSEALSQISRSDFPEKWPTLADDLAAQLKAAQGAGNMAGVNSVLETATAVFERFRNASDDDETRTALRTALDSFAAPLTAAFLAVSARLDAACAQPSATLAAVTPELRALGSMCNAFFLLSWIDLPDVFEDVLKEWMGGFHKYLSLADPKLQAPPEEEEEGPLEALQAAVLECVELYSDKYDEEFSPYQPALAQDLMALLSSMPPARQCARCTDNLVMRAMRLLASIAGKPEMSAVFSEEGLLRGIMGRIVVPNMALRASDVEAMEDNPADFIAGDIEGGDSESRRRVAGDVVRAFVRIAPVRAVAIAMEAVGASLAAYAADRAGAEGAKDTAVALLMAVAIKAQTAQCGVTVLTEGVNVREFLAHHVASELVDANINARPLAKAACIKFLASFRSTFSAAELHQLLPILVTLMGAQHYVVHTYAAAAFERILTVKDRGVRPAGEGSGGSGSGGGEVRFAEPRVSLEALAPLATPALGALFARMRTPQFGGENEYLMRCVMRVVTMAKGHCTGAVGDIAGALGVILARVCKAPANPVFNHFLFESLGSLMRTACTAQPGLLVQFEGLLFPTAQAVMDGDVLEFLPYVFQLLTAALLLHPPPPAPLSPGFKAFLLPHLLQPRPWQRKSSIPALTELLKAYLARAPGEFYGGAGGGDCSALITVLNIWQLLLKPPPPTKGQEGFSFSLFNGLVVSLPPEALAPHLPLILQGMLTSVYESKAARVARGFIHSVALLCGVAGPGAFVATLAALKPTLLPELLDAVVAPLAEGVAGRTAKMEASIGLTRLLCETPSLLQGDPAPWVKLLTAVLKLAGGAGGGSGGGSGSGSGSGGGGSAGGTAVGGTAASRAALLGGSAAFMEDEDLPQEEDALGGLPVEYASSFNRLIHCATPTPYAFAATFPAPAAYLSQSLKRLIAAAPQVQAIIAASAVAPQVTNLLR